MDISMLCDEINLQPKARDRVLAFAGGFDFGTVERQLKDFLVYEKMKEAEAGLRAVLNDDEDHMQILACMLKASADAYDIYKDKGISDEIYFATMKCYTRFIDETMKMTGRLCFDRYWWTARQAGCHLFRIGELEYEMMHTNYENDHAKAIEIHIPSDADFSPGAVDRSLAEAQRFFAEYYPAFTGVEYRCHSWLLDGQLQEMLSENSNIYQFQHRFEIFDQGEEDMEFIEWLFHTKSTDYAALPEDTSLQRNVKRHLLAGRGVRSAGGRLKS